MSRCHGILSHYHTSSVNPFVAHLPSFRLPPSEHSSRAISTHKSPRVWNLQSAMLGARDESAKMPCWLSDSGSMRTAGGHRQGGGKHRVEKHREALSIRTSQYGIMEVLGIRTVP